VSGSMEPCSEGGAGGGGRRKIPCLRRLGQGDKRKVSVCIKLCAMSNSTAWFNIIASGDALLKVHSYELRIKQEGRTKQADKGYKQEGNKTGRQSCEQHSLIA